VSRLKKLKSLFIEQEETAAEESKSEKKEKPEQGKVVIPSKPLANNVNVKGEADNKIIDTLLNAVEKNNLEGFDYLEYKKSLQTMKKMSMAEEMMYQSAFATASTMGVTLKRLVETAEYYIKIMDKEMHNFGEAVARQNNEMVVKRREQSNLVAENLTQKEKQIEQLQQEIVNLKEKQQKLNTEIEQAAVKIEQTKANFEKSFLHLREQFESDIVKMKKYLK